VVKKKKLLLLLHPHLLLHLLQTHPLLRPLHLLRKPPSNFYLDEKKPPQGGFFSPTVCCWPFTGPTPHLISGRLPVVSK
jgi:hypothetical protein